MFHDGPEASSTRFAPKRFLRDRLKRGLRKAELHAIELKELGVLLHQGILRLREDIHEGVLVKLVKRRNDRQAANELRNKPALEQVLRLYLLEQLAELTLARGRDVRSETE